MMCISHLYVNQLFRRYGFGKKLLDHIEEYCIHSG